MKWQGFWICCFSVFQGFAITSKSGETRSANIWSASSVLSKRFLYFFFKVNFLQLFPASIIFCESTGQISREWNRFSIWGADSKFGVYGICDLFASNSKFISPFELKMCLKSSGVRASFSLNSIIRLQRLFVFLTNCCVLLKILIVFFYKLNWAFFRIQHIQYCNFNFLRC